MYSKILILLTFLSFMVCSCNMSEKRQPKIGYLKEFKKVGIVFKSYEVIMINDITRRHESEFFNFSIANTTSNRNLIKKMDMSCKYGCKVKIWFEESKRINPLNFIGMTDIFAADCEIIGCNLDEFSPNTVKEINNVRIDDYGKKDTFYTYIHSEPKLNKK